LSIKICRKLTAISITLTCHQYRVSRRRFTWI